jgi:glycosyltransferase involved in cell wall biosynthesis
MTNDDYVLIIEPDLSGHRWRYAQWAADAYLEAGYRCLIVTERCNAQHELARRIVAENNPQLQIDFVDVPARASKFSLASSTYVRYHREFQDALAVASHGRRVVLIVVPYVDYFLYALPFLGSPFGNTPWIGITMRSTFHHGQVGVKGPRRRLVNALKAQLFKRAVKSTGMKTLLTIDPTLLQWYARLRSVEHAAEQAPEHARVRESEGAAIEYLADPFPDVKATDPALAKQRLGLGAGKHLLVYGLINQRKGIHELVEACAQRSDAPTLVVAGNQDGDTHDFLQHAATRLSPAPVILDQFISSEVELDLFSACDAVWLGYKGHYGMSGVLVQAYRFAKPVIATADGLIGWFCKNAELGTVIDDLSSPTINRALDRVLLDAPQTMHGAAAAEDHLLARNTLSQFKLTLQQAGLGPRYVDPSARALRPHHAA